MLVPVLLDCSATQSNSSPNPEGENIQAHNQRYANLKGDAGSFVNCILLLLLPAKEVGV